MLPEAGAGWARTCLPGPSPNRPRCTLRGDGTASLDDREFRDILRSTQRKVVFSGAVAQPNEAPHASYFAVLSRMSPGDTAAAMAEPGYSASSSSSDFASMRSRVSKPSVNQL